ncbi:O-antigen ligase family protein [Thermoleophilum album]|uniref:O-antigen ligase family protein n=1 Tax=Thermoleophilum album TaxID=29539 RepID=UPI00237D213E|nr:O-antigen ligase family protein [Thermoleophilum album]MCL6441631.1 O-antigen ligase family protein [Thermoleophilum sp.]WDT94138.1 O-antigen ligase family protein [Thermoleophilum album]
MPRIASVFATALAATVAVACSFVPAFYAGGFFDRPRLVAGAVVWAALALAFAVAERPWPRTRAQVLAVAGLAALSGWTLLSLAWAPIAGRVEDDAQRAVLYLGLLALALVGLRSRTARVWFEPILLVGLGTICAVGLSERLVPDLVELDRSQTAAGRLEQPLTYWNGMGLVAAWAWLVAARIAGDVTRSRLVRALAGATLPAWGLTLYLTFSRAGLVAAAAGIVVLTALAPHIRAQLAALVAGGGASVLAAVVANRLPTVRSLDVGVTGNPSEGHEMLFVLLALGALCALLVAAPSRSAGGSAQSVPVRRAAIVLSAAVVALAGGIAAVAASDIRPAAESPVRGATPERLRSIDTNRYAYWEIAVEMARREPLRGEGAGSFAVAWRARPNRPDRATDAHSLYLETLAELGVVGLAALVAFLGAVVAGAMGALRCYPAAAVGPAAVISAWLVHAGVDWDWELPAATMPAVLASAAVLAWAEKARPGHDRTPIGGASRTVPLSPGNSSPRTATTARVRGASSTGERC